MVVGVRYVLPALLVVGGIVLVAIEPNVIGLEGLLMAIGAALSVLLLNVLVRIGAQGDRERDMAWRRPLARTSPSTAGGRTRSADAAIATALFERGWVMCYIVTHNVEHRWCP